MTPNTSDKSPFRGTGEEFEHYVERQFYHLFNSIHNLEYISKETKEQMGTLAETLGVDETILAEVIPALATEINGLQASLAEKAAALIEKVAALTAAESTETTDVEALAAAKAELRLIQGVAESLAPVVAKAKEIAPAAPVVEVPPVPVTPVPPVEVVPITPPAETPTPPAETSTEIPPVPVPPTE